VRKKATSQHDVCVTDAYVSKSQFYSTACFAILRCTYSPI